MLNNSMKVIKFPTDNHPKLQTAKTEIFNEFQKSKPELPWEIISDIIKTCKKEMINCNEGAAKITAFCLCYISKSLLPVLANYQEKAAQAKRTIPSKEALLKDLKRKLEECSVDKEEETKTWPANELFFTILMGILALLAGIGGVITLGTIILDAVDWPHPIFAYIFSFGIFMAFPFGFKTMDGWISTKKPALLFKYRMCLTALGIISGLGTIILWAALAPMSSNNSEYAELLLGGSRNHDFQNFLTFIKTALSFLWEPFIGSICWIAINEKWGEYSKKSHKKESSSAKLEQQYEDHEKTIANLYLQVSLEPIAQKMYDDMVEAFAQEAEIKFYAGL